MTPALSAALAAAAIGLALFAFARRQAARAQPKPKTAPPLATAGLLLVVSGFFAAFCLLAPRAAETRWVGLAVFVATAALFRLMTRFESPT